MRSSKLSFLVVFALLVCAAFASSPFWNTRTVDTRAFRTVGDLFEVRKLQGWTVLSAPTDSRRYRVCGSTESDPTSGAQILSGEFRVEDRFVPFSVPIPEGETVAIEGLDPMDGGQLSYAVFSRPKKHGRN